jgi:hypothetical protein
MSLQALVDAACSGTDTERRGDIVIAARTTYDLTDTLLISSVKGLELFGRGRSTIIRWLGPADRPVVHLQDCANCIFADFEIQLSTPALEAIRISDSGTGSIRSTHNIVSNIRVADSVNLVTVVNIGGGVDSKNDFMSLYDIDAEGFTVGLAVDGQNSVGHELWGCVFKGRTNGQRGITVGMGPLGPGGSLHMYGGALIQCRDVCIELSTRSQSIGFDGVHFEANTRLLRAAATGAFVHTVVHIDNFRYGADQADLPVDGVIVDYRAGGTLVISNGSFSSSYVDGSGIPLNTYKFHYDSNFTQGTFKFENVRVKAVNAADFWPGRNPTSVSGSLLLYGITDGTLIAMPSS